MQSLRSILIRFGERQYGIAGDIANMFFQIQIAPEDRDMIRILWFSESDMKGDVVAYQFQVAPYGLRCIPSMAGYALMFTAESNIPDASNEATANVTQDMFEDDLISDADTIEDGQRVIREVSLLLKSTGFTMKKRNASHKEILADISEEDLAPAIRNLGENGSDLEMGPRHATLGVIWDTKEDNMVVKKPILEPQSKRKFTKRQAVSLSHQFLDPMGWWSPFLVRLKLCCSKFMRLVNDWDAQVPPDLINEWNMALRDLDNVENVPFARRRVPINISAESRYEYHVFADSSEDIAAAAVYLRVQTGKNYTVSLRRLHTGKRMRLRWEIPKVQATSVYDSSGKIKHLCSQRANACVATAATCCDCCDSNGKHFIARPCRIDCYYLRKHELGFVCFNNHCVMRQAKQ